MTVENGCTPEEADTAKRKLDRIYESTRINPEIIYKDLPSVRDMWKRAGDINLTYPDSKSWKTSFNDFFMVCRMYDYWNTYSKGDTELLQVFYKNGLEKANKKITVSIIGDNEFFWVLWYDNITIKSGEGIEDFKTFVLNSDDL